MNIKKILRENKPVYTTVREIREKYKYDVNLPPTLEIFFYPRGDIEVPQKGQYRASLPQLEDMIENVKQFQKLFMEVSND